MKQATFGLTARALFHGRLQSELLEGEEPGAGEGYTYEVSPNYSEVFWLLTFELATASHSATREVVLNLLTPTGKVVGAIPAGSTQTASLTYTYSFVFGVGNVNAETAAVVTSPMFSMVIPPLYALEVAVANMYETDQISAIYGYRDRYTTDPIEGYPVGGVLVPDDVDEAAQVVELTT